MTVLTVPPAMIRKTHDMVSLIVYVTLHMSAPLTQHEKETGKREMHFRMHARKCECISMWVCS